MSCTLGLDFSSYGSWVGLLVFHARWTRKLRLFAEYKLRNVNQNVSSSLNIRYSLLFSSVQTIHSVLHTQYPFGKGILHWSTKNTFADFRFMWIPLKQLEIPNPWMNCCVIYGAVEKYCNLYVKCESISRALPSAILPTYT